MTEHARIGERTFPYLAPADRPTLRKQPIGCTEAVFESGEVGIALNTIPSPSQKTKRKGLVSKCFGFPYRKIQIPIRPIRLSFLASKTLGAPL